MERPVLNKMRVCIVYRGPHLLRQALDLEVMASLLRDGGHCVECVYDPDPFGVTDNVLQVPTLARLFAAPGRLAAEIFGGNPDVVVFSVIPATHAWATQIAALLKRARHVPIVFLGLHPSLAPQRAMQNPSVDFAIQGEAEGVILPLLAAIAAGQGFDKVGNLWHRREGGGSECRGTGDGYAFTFRAPLVDLDALPFPDKHLFRPYVASSYSYAAMVSRGCPFACSFCEETCMRRVCGPGYFRRKKVDTVIDELAWARDRYPFQEVIFKDSYLSGNETWLADLMARYRRDIRVPFKCFCTIAGFTETTARLLKEGGCYCVEFGLQTWNDTIRSRVLSRKESAEDAQRAFDICAAHGLWYDVDHMFGLPGESEEDHRQAALAYKRLRFLNRVKVHNLVYLPTAGIVREGIGAGHLPADAEALLADGRESSFWKQAPSRLLAGYSTLLKILPLLPCGVVRWLTAGKRVLLLRFLPRLVVAALQGLVALRSGDRRFLLYLRLYPAKIWRAARRPPRTAQVRRSAASPQPAQANER
jgi:tRNA A37 methylthiotransferase MiaB